MTRYSMQFIADIIKKLNEDKLITIEDLYILKESEIIEKIKNSKYKEEFTKWENATKVKTSINKPNTYYVKVLSKVRYIDPLFNGKRMSNECKIAKKMIDKNLAYNMNKYVYLQEEIWYDYRGIVNEKGKEKNNI